MQDKGLKVNVGEGICLDKHEGLSQKIKDLYKLL